MPIIQVYEILRKSVLCTSFAQHELNEVQTSASLFTSALKNPGAQLHHAFFIFIRGVSDSGTNGITNTENTSLLSQKQKYPNISGTKILAGR